MRTMLQRWLAPFLKTMYERFFYDVVLVRKQGLIYTLLRSILRFFSLFFYSAVLLRRMLYRLGIRRSFTPTSLTIVVGNIAVGGTGKTPFTIFLTEKLSKKMPCAVLTSGYRAEHGNGAYGGDEAALIRRALPSVPLFVGRDRVASAKQAQKEARCLILDDGLQHLALSPHVRIVMIDATAPFGGGYLLPGGLLREPLSVLQGVDLMVLHRVDLAHNVQEIENTLRKYTSSPIIHSEFVFNSWHDQSGNAITLSEGTKVALFCGIARPEQFQQLVSKKLTVVLSRFGKDHVGLNENELEAFIKDAVVCGAEACVCTEKDIVRLTKKVSFPLYWAKGSIKIVHGQDILEQCIAGWTKRV